MDRKELIKKLLPGLIPVFVFIIADELWGTKIGLLVAVGTGVVEMAVTWVREQRMDRFVLLDTALLVLMGGISLVLENDIFFKLKPGLIELILCGVLGVSAFSKVNIVGLMAQRYMKDMEMNDDRLKLFRRNLKFMFWAFMLHAALVFYAAFFLSKEAWAFISGVLFYIFFVAVFVVGLLMQRIKRRKDSATEEWLPLVDEKGAVKGKAPRSHCHKGEKLLHPVVHLHVLNHQRHIFLQKRPDDKLVQPGKWDTAVGGHISFGEQLDEALKREAWEEIGLKEFSAKLVAQYVWETEMEAELVYVFVSYNYKGIHIHSDEVVEGKFWSSKKIKGNLGKDIFTPNFEHEYRMMFAEDSLT